MDNIIHSTKDYGMFSFLKENRPLRGEHVLALTKAITKNNMLAYNPIIVNKNFQIIDGQHRFIVAKNNELDLYYVIRENASVEDVIVLNSTVRPWELNDYLRLYIHQEKEDYIKIAQYMDESSLSISSALMILTGSFQTKGYGLRDIFKSGEFKITEPVLANEFLYYLGVVKSVCTIQTVWRDREFLQAIYRFTKKGGDVDVLAQKSLETGKKIEKRELLADYLLQIEQIYNSGNTARVKTRFW